MAVELDLRGRKHLVGEAEGEPDKGPKCEAKFGEQICGRTASPHFCEPRVLLIENGLRELNHSELGDEKFEPLNWQRERVIEPLFGVVVWDEQQELWLRRYRVVWCSVPRKQGKSMLVAALTALMMRLLPKGSDMLLGAQTEEEAAKVVGGHTRDFISSSPAWDDDIEWKAGVKEFLSKSRNVSCRIKAINRPESARGAMWAWSVLDEIAFYRDPQESLAVVRSSWGSVKEPVIICITTLPGDAMEWGRTHNQWAVEVSAEPDMAESLLPVISMIADGDDWQSEDTWRRVCPALEEGVQSLRDFKEAAKEAATNPGLRSKFQTERLNAPALSEAPFIPVEVWRGQKRNMERAEVLEEISKIEYGVYAGCDFSRVSDFTSMAFVGSVGEYVYIWQQSWIPEPVAVKLDKLLSGRVSEWLEQGCLRVLPDGASSEYVAKALHETIKGFTSQVMVGYDIHEAMEAEKYWDAQSVQREACPQGRVLSPAIKKLQDMAHAGLLIHGNDPVLEYAAGCAEIRITEQEKWAIIKPERKISAARVDSLVAVATAFHTRTRNLEVENPWVGKII